MALTKKEKKMKPSPNRARAHERAPMDGKVYIHDEARLFIAPLDNISEGGLFISGLTSIEKGVEVRIVIKSDGLNKPVQVRGEIVRVEDDWRQGSAVQFCNVDARLQALIRNSVEVQLGGGKRKGTTTRRVKHVPGRHAS